MINKQMKYAGIGPRNTPIPVCEEMFSVAQQLDSQGWVVRSGHAEGADQAWECGHHPDRREIYLPWTGFNNGFGRNIVVAPYNCEIEAVAKMAHPRWEYLKQGAQKLMARNVSIILGPELDDPVEFVAYWSPMKKVEGGTGNAVRLAIQYGIPAFNICFEQDQKLMSELVSA